MFDFNYFTPTKVVFGKNTESKVADLIKEFKGTKVLIHYGGGSVVRSGLLKRVTDTLDAAGIGYVTLGGAVPNPHLGLVYEGIELCKECPLLPDCTPIKKCPSEIRCDVFQQKERIINLEIAMLNAYNKYKRKRNETQN